MDTDSVPEQVRQDVQQVTADDRWYRAYEKARRTRLQRVQASARVWLGVLTTLLGLLGSVVLFKGGDLVTGVPANGWFQSLLILLVALVFTSAILAMIAGGAATWGGLDDIAPSGESDRAVGRPVDPVWPR
jgi:protein-S-isoprenylcysteine O-methyltransferase Ste14